MSKLKYHGSYPDHWHQFRNCSWRRICGLSTVTAAALYNDALWRQGKATIELDRFGYYQNKCFTVVQESISHVVAIYKEDFKWWLVETDRAAFLKAWSGLKNSKPFDHFDYRGTW